MVLEINNENFESEVKQSDIPVIVDFWAEWCGPCKMMAPVFEQLSSDFEGKLKFAKVNVDDNREVASQFGVRGIPCLVVVNKGSEVDRITGYAPKDVLKQKIEDILSKI